MSAFDVPRSVALLADHLLVGATMRAYCPSLACSGKPDMTMTITRTGPRSFAYNCHRASCQARGYIGDPPSRTGGGGAAPVKEHERYLGDVFELYESYKFYFEQRFGILLEGERKLWVQQNSANEFVMPVRNPYGGLRGFGIRRGAWKDRDGAPKCPLPHVLPKFRSFLHEDKDPLMSWYFPSVSGDLWPVTDDIVLVEDQVSAMKVATRGCVGVALMGTELNMEKAREIQRHGGPGNVIIALDADATDKAFKMARTWGAGLRNCRVAILDEDLKDSESIIVALGLRSYK